MTKLIDLDEYPDWTIQFTIDGLKYPFHKDFLTRFMGTWVNPKAPWGRQVMAPDAAVSGQKYKLASLARHVAVAKQWLANDSGKSADDIRRKLADVLDNFDGNVVQGRWQIAKILGEIARHPKGAAAQDVVARFLAKYPSLG